MRAKPIGLYFAGLGSSRIVERQRKTGFGLSAIVVAAGVRAMTQTGQVRDSVLFEWWWATTASADHNVSNKHKHAVTFASDRIPHNQCC